MALLNSNGKPVEDHLSHLVVKGLMQNLFRDRPYPIGSRFGFA